MEDRCKVDSGPFKDQIGTVVHISENQIATIKTLEKFPVPIKMSALNLSKHFEVGDNIMVLQGVHSGEVGVILDICQPERTHAITLMNTSKTELKILTSNLKRVEQVDLSCKLSVEEFLGQTGRRRPVGKSV